MYTNFVERRGNISIGANHIGGLYIEKLKISR